jgi:hypothetical protein
LKRLAAAAVATVLVLGLAGCDPKVNATVCHWGDSILRVSADAFLTKEQFRNRAYLAVFNAIDGAGLSEWTKYWEDRIPDVLRRVDCDAHVVSLGENDASDATVTNNPDAFTAVLVRALSADDADVPIVLIMPPGNQRGHRVIRNSYRRVTARRPNVLMVWPENIPGWRTVDGTHPTERGQLALAEKIVDDGLDVWFGGPDARGGPFDPPRRTPPRGP